MFEQFDAITQSFRQKIAEGINGNDHCRARQYVIFLIIGIPVLIYFAFLNLINSNFLLTVLISLLSLSLLLTKSWIEEGKYVKSIFRFNAVLYSALVLYLMIMGGEAGSKILWMYTYPLIAFFLVGKKEGLAWNSGVFIIALVILYVPINFISVYHYAPEFAFRFVLTYLIISAITFWFEFLRHTYRIESELKTHRLLYEQHRLEEEIARREQLEKELLTLAHTDMLSGALNRRRFWEMVNYELKRREELRRDMVMMILDIDHFKRINDTYGHMMGDEVIRNLAGYCQMNLRSSDIFARIGGEEFAVLLTDITPEESVVNAERLREGLAHMKTVSTDSFITFTVSIGMTAIRSEDTCIEAVLKRSDEALYEAKARGRNCVIML